MDLTCKSFVNISELGKEDNSVQKKRRLGYDKKCCDTIRFRTFNF